MTTLAYFDCPAGLAGDMCLGALVDAGVPLDYLASQLMRLGLSDTYTLRQETVHKRGQRATKVHVELNSSDTHHRHWPDIAALIRTAGLPPKVTTWSLAVFEALAKAEGTVHGIPPEKVHFHEVGAIDAIVDIVGTCLGLDWLGVERIDCSALPTGGGTVETAHGRLPVPTPAVLELCRAHRIPLYGNGIDRELVTPTGAALMAALASGFGPAPGITLERVGLGAGTWELPIPNLARLWVGYPYSSSSGPDSRETVAVLETQIDDFSPQGIAYASECLGAAGALDVFTQAIGMKKGRPAVLLTVICTPDLANTCEGILFRETPTLGVRHTLQQRRILERAIHTLDTRFGPVRVKVARLGSQVVNVQPEYEDCAQIARTTQRPWREIHQFILHQWHTRADLAADSTGPSE
ncbi:MAG: nickel pincer cofactor biosynthesis protein LarC [Gloeomargaritaceae cyanobacterium C42_A2020_066]|nr:nickel pincer cofactor biosynthesis protein LarC [Gloeomargaritaceae cyanobacterium C42_A2020_066]